MAQYNIHADGGNVTVEADDLQIGSEGAIVLRKGDFGRRDIVAVIPPRMLVTRIVYEGKT